MEVLFNLRAPNADGQVPGDGFQTNKRSGGTRAAISSEQTDAMFGSLGASGMGGRTAVGRRRGSHSAESSSGLLGSIKQNFTVEEKKPEVAERIFQAMQGTTIQLFTDMDKEQLKQIASAMTEVNVAAGETVIVQGAPGDFFYVIEEGTYVAEVDGVAVKEYGGQGSFGELALMHGMARAASVKATTAGKLWRLDRGTFRAIVVISNVLRRKRNVELLGNIEAWQGVLTLQQRQSIADCLDWAVFQDGQYILREGDATDDESNFYILDKGSVNCYRTVNDEKQLVKTMAAPGYFGEMAFVENSGRRFADVQAVGEVQVLCLNRGAFERLMGPLSSILSKDVENMRQVYEGLLI